MEYIEPAPKQEKPHAKRNKIIIASVIGAVVVTAIALTYYFVITKIFIEYQNIDLFVYSYRYDDPNAGVRIDAVKDDATLPATFRIPNKLGGRKVVEIADEVFSENSDIEEMIFPDSLEKIGNNCFYNCVNLKKFNVPSHISSIGTDAFLNTAWLNNQDDGEVAIGNMLYTYKGEMEYPASVVKNMDSPAASYSGTVVDLSKYIDMSSGVFKNQTALIYAELPETYQTVHESTFENCTSLEIVNLPNSLKTISSSAFSVCSSLSFVHIPENVNYIGDYAFSYSKLSGDISLNNNFEYLGYGAFEGCEEVTSVSFSAGFEYISDSLFEGCIKLSSVKFDNKEFTSESTISYIGEYAFAKTAISDFHIPFNVTSVKKYAFAECPNLISIYTLNNIDGFAENIHALDESLGKYVWKKSEGSYQGVLKFEIGVFKNSPNFESIVLVDNNNNNVSALGEINVPITTSSLGGKNDDAYFISGTSVSKIHLGKDLSVVSKPEYKEVLKARTLSTIAPSFAEGASKLTLIDFGGSNSTITTINRAAFKDCVSLETIEIHDNVSTIETNVFEGCTSLKNVTLPTKCSTITTKTFYGCSSLMNINIPENYKTIGQEAFANCSKLETVNLGSNPSISNIGQAAFANCVSLKSFNIPNTCNALAQSVFSNCSSLTQVTISNSSTLKELKTGMFENTALTEIVVPSNISNIGNNVFAGSTLTKITLEANKVVSIGNNVFPATLEKIYVPNSLINDYKTNSSWSVYSNIIFGID